MSYQEEKRKWSEEEGGSPSNQKSTKLLRSAPFAAPNPNANPVVSVTYPGSKQDIPWARMLSPLPLIDAVNLESVSKDFKNSVFTGQTRLVWSFNYRNCLIHNHGLADNVPAFDKALRFLVKKIGKNCRQLIIKDTHHPPNDYHIFNPLKKLKSLYLKYGPSKSTLKLYPDSIINEPAWKNDTFQIFLKDAFTKLHKLPDADRPELRIDVSRHLFSAYPNSQWDLTALEGILKPFYAFLTSRRFASLTSYQFSRYDKYKFTSLNLQHLRKLRTTFYGEGLAFPLKGLPPEVVQYQKFLGQVVGKLETLYIKWEESGSLDLLTRGNDVNGYNFLHPLKPLYDKLSMAPSPSEDVPFLALSIEFAWKNLTFARAEIGQREGRQKDAFRVAWNHLAREMSKMPTGKIHKLSLALPAGPDRQGYFYFSDHFIQQLVSYLYLKYLRLVFKQEMPVPLSFGAHEIQTLEIVFSYLKKMNNPGETIQRARDDLVYTPEDFNNTLINTQCNYWTSKMTLKNPVRAFKLKYGAFLDAPFAAHLAVAFPKLELFSFTAFDAPVYQEDDFLEGLTELVLLCKELRVIKLADNFNKSPHDFADLLKTLAQRANLMRDKKFTFYAPKAIAKPNCQPILDQSRQVGSNLRIYMDFSEIEAQQSTPNSPWQTPGNSPRYEQPIYQQPTPPQQNQPDIVMQAILASGVNDNSFPNASPRHSPSSQGPNSDYLDVPNWGYSPTAAPNSPSSSGNSNVAPSGSLSPGNALPANPRIPVAAPTAANQRPPTSLFPANVHGVVNMEDIMAFFTGPNSNNPNNDNPPTN